MSELTSHQRTMIDTEPAKAPVGAPLRAPQTPQPGRARHSSSPAPWRRPFIWIALLVVVAIVAGFYLFHRTQVSNQSAGETQRIARVEQRDFVRSVRVNGTVEAVETHPIVAPRLAIQNAGQLTLTKLLTTGTIVKKGDIVAEFDRQSQIRDALDREAEFHDFEQQINKLVATQASDKSVDDTGIKQAEDAVSTAELEYKKSEVLSRIDAEKKQEDLDEANAKLKQARETYLLKRQSAAAALRLLEIQRDAKKLAMEHSNGNAVLLSIPSPANGLVVINSTWKQGGLAEWLEGDTVGAGRAFMQVVNPGAMRVRANVNQQDMREIQSGQRVEVRLDAYPDQVFHGKVDLISAIGITDDFSPNVHTFAILFTIEGADPKLLPDLSAAVDIELERKSNSLVVPRDSLLVDGGKTYVQVISGNAAGKREVKVSEMTDVEALVVSGLQPGETVLRGVAPQSLLTAGAPPSPPQK
jgi:HlyD family secretion protein